MQEEKLGAEFAAVVHISQAEGGSGPKKEPAREAAAAQHRKPGAGVVLRREEPSKPERSGLHETNGSFNGRLERNCSKGPSQRTAPRKHLPVCLDRPVQDQTSRERHFPFKLQPCPPMPTHT